MHRGGGAASSIEGFGRKCGLQAHLVGNTVNHFSCVNQFITRLEGRMRTKDDFKLAGCAGSVPLFDDNIGLDETVHHSFDAGQTSGTIPKGGIATPKVWCRGIHRCE